MDYSRHELDLIYQSLEITFQTMDRPEPGTGEDLQALMRKTTGLMAMLPKVETVNQYADEVMTHIHEDIAEGIKNSHGVTIPKFPGSFSALHEYCDANMYLLAIPKGRMRAEQHNDLINEVSDECDRRLLAEYLEAFSQAGEDGQFAANCTCARGATHFHAIWPERGCLSPRCPEQAQGAWVGCQGYFRS